MSLFGSCSDDCSRLISVVSEHDGEKLINTVADNNSNTIVVIQ